jgi:hypothetical protein
MHILCLALIDGIVPDAVESFAHVHYFQLVRIYLHISARRHKMAIFKEAEFWRRLAHGRTHKIDGATFITVLRRWCTGRKIWSG